MTDTPRSPRIDALIRSAAAGESAAVDAFWQRAAAEGTPIVETIDGDDHYRLLTFIYRDEPGLTNVVVWPGMKDGLTPANNLMQRIEGTDVWYRTYRVRNDLRATYFLSLNDPLEMADMLSTDQQAAWMQERIKWWRADPLNPHQFAFEPGMPPRSLVELPDAPPQPYVEKRGGLPEGTVEREDLERDPFGTGRRIWTYLPPGYDPARGPYPLVVAFDGWAYRRMGLHTTLDNMIAEGVIEPVVAIMVHQLDRMKELAVNADFAGWLADDFIPSWRAKYAITDDPARTAVAGMSLGGLQSAFCGLRHPDVFGNILSQSGSYWWRPEGERWQWLTDQFEASPRLLLRWYMDVGLLEDTSRDSDGHPSMLDSNRRLRDVLLAKGNDLHYTEFNGGHDYVSWQGTIADGLAYLLPARH